MMNTYTEYQNTIEALVNQAYRVFEEHFPGWSDFLFDETFLAEHTAPMLESYGSIAPNDLVNAWAAQIHWQDDTIREQRITELLPVATHFLLILDSIIRHHYH